MNERQTTIGVTDLLDEVSRDLDDFRKKHPGDYSLKGITLWWELERERLLVRHRDTRVARRFVLGRRAWVLLSGCLVTFILGALTTLLVS